ncbi:ISAs1 family transposase [Micromonospora sp. NPDC049102]|uniref:ISAs1 family transposase n=1 Tax=Micromonospora sp. NPDC049102 TaxID=3364265 RepID=UPI003712417B
MSSPCRSADSPVLGSVDAPLVRVQGLLDRLGQVEDPRDPRGVRYGLATLLAIGVCALSASGHNSLTAIAEWVRRCEQRELSRLGCPFDPFTGRYRVPDERTLRDVYAKVDPADLTAVGYGYLTALARPGSASLTPDGVGEREQRRAHRAPAGDPTRRGAIAVDGKCLRGAKRRDGSQVFILSAVRHADAVTLAARQIPAKTNEISEFAPLLDQIADTDLTNTVVTADALHAQRAHAVYLVEQRHAHYLFTVKDNQPSLAAQLRALPCKQVPVLHRQSSRGHGRHEIREVQVVTVNDLLFPHARQAVRIRRRRRRPDTKTWATEIVYAITDLPTHEARPAEIATWAREHWTIENSVHWIRDVTFGEDASQIRTHNTPAVMAALRDIVRSTIRLAGWANTASARRAHTIPDAALTLHGIP